MNFFDKLIDEVDGIIAPCTKSEFAFSPDKASRDVGRNELVLQRDMAFELEGVGFNLITSKSLGDSSTVVVGSDLPNISSYTKFARVTVIEIDDVDDEDEQKAYDLIRKIEYIKYHYFPEGYMVRSSSADHIEDVRVSKNAVKNGISFENVGNLLISKYLEHKSVKAVRNIFITDKSVDFKQLEKLAFKNYDITEALNHIMKNINFDCNACNLKAICDEVEGMKELHFKKSGM